MKTSLKPLYFLRSLSYLGFTFMLTLLACEKGQELEEPVNMHYNYYPIDSGQQISYWMDSFVYDKFQDTIHSFRFLVIDKVTGIWINEDETEIYRVERTYSDSASGPAQKVIAYSVNKTANNLRLTLNNTEKVKLVFPPFAGKEWDANAFNSLEPEIYMVEKFSSPFSGAYESFDHTATVIEEDQENLIERNSVHSVYAENIGLVYYEEMDLSYQDTIIPDPSIPWEQRANEGYILRYHFLDHEGFEDN